MFSEQEPNVRFFGVRMKRGIRSLVSFLCVAVAAKHFVLAEQPTVTLMTPPGFQQGTQAEVTLTGARLDDSTQILFYGEGVEVVALAADGTNKVKAQLRIAEDCVPGLHPMRLATETGISNLRYFGVSPLPQTDEIEPNSDFEKPQRIEMNTTVNGIIQTEDVDYYAVQLAAGQKITVEIEGLRLGTEFFDPAVSLLDSNRFEVARSDDATFVQQDCLCSYVAERPGTYWIEVRESSYGGNDRCQYRMHVGDFPRPVAIVPAGGRSGERIQATIIDASGESWTDTIQLPHEPGEFDYVANRDGKSAPSPNKLRVVDLPNVMEHEPDEDREAIVAVDAPVALNGVLQEPGDVDWFKIKGKKNETLEFRVYGRSVLRSPIDSWLEIHKASGGRLAVNDDAGGPDSAQAFKFPEDGEYLVAIRDQLNEGSPIHAYRMEITPTERSVTLTIDELIRYMSQTVEVPRGGQMAVLLRARRSGVSGDLALRLEGAPEGIELTTPTIAANQSYIPLMLKAAANVPPDATLARLVAEVLPDGSDVQGFLDQRTMLVRGQNNRDMWGHNTDKLAIAVTKERPFTIGLEPPQVPLVRDGTLNFTIRATRQEGYKERIYLRPLHTPYPEGCTASRSVVIEPNQTEVQVPITANSKAELGEFPFAFLAQPSNRNAAIWVASEFVKLEVADSFFEFQFGKSVVESGQSGGIVVGVSVKRPPEGDVEFEVVGLPAGVTCEQTKVKWVEGMEQVSFPVQVAADAPARLHKTIYVNAKIKRAGGEILQTAGRGELLLTAPTPVSNAVAQSEKSQTGEAATKPLSRLEQLRQAKGLLGGSEQ